MKSPITWSLVVLSLLCAWVPSANAQPTEPEAENYFILSERDTGFWLSADALVWKRNNSGGGGNIIGGPEALSFGNAGFHHEGGYRLGVGWLIDPNYEVEGYWTQFNGWNANSSGVLTRAISFDGNAANVFFDPPAGGENFVNTTTFFRPLFDAATDDPGAVGGADDETTEFEFMQPGSAYTLRRTSEMSDGQVNFKTRRTQGRRFSIGLGYRHIDLSETALVGITGTFDAVDNDDGEEIIDNNPNDQLSDAALTAHGLTGVGGGFDDPSLGGGDFTMLWSGAANNKLNGLQGVLDGTILERGRFALDGNLRAGVFLNRARGTIVEQYSQTGGSVYGRTFTDEADRASFAANVGLSGSVRLGERFFLRAGYEAMFVTNVGTGPSQQQGIVYDGLGNASYSVQTGDAIVLQGLRAGFDFQW